MSAWLPPHVELRSREGIATTHAALRLDPAPSRDISGAIESEIKRVNLISNVMASPPVVGKVARMAGIDADRIATSARSDENVPAALGEPDNERHANQLLLSRDPYKLEIQARATVPIFDIYTQAPTVRGAEDLANASIAAVNLYLRELAKERGVAGPQPVALQQLGSAQGALLDPLAPIKIGLLTFIVVFAVTAGLLYALVQVRRGWLLGPSAAASTSGRDAEPEGSAPGEGGDWPHTTRTLPWLIAGFIAMLWLVPVNAIWLEASLPIDLKLDRIVVPVIVLVWLLSLAAKGPGAPRWRFTRVHAAIAGFVAVAFISVVLNATYLNQTLELAVAIKKLVLLGAFFSIFLVISSALRPREVRPFLTFILVLATICGIGILWEYRFESNLFYAWSAKLLPSVFHATPLTVEIRRHRTACGDRAGGPRPRGGRDARDGPAHRAGPADAVRGVEEEGSLRPRDLRAARSDGRHLPQERAAGSPFGLRGARLLPSPRADQTGAARDRHPPGDSDSRPLGTGVGARTVQAPQARGRDGQRPGLRLRRDQARRPQPSRVRARVRLI